MKSWIQQKTSYVAIDQNIFVDALFQSVAEDGGKAQTEAEEMEISTRSRGKNISSNRTKCNIHV